MTYGSAKTPGVSSWLDAHPAPDFIWMAPCGQSARSPSLCQSHVGVKEINEGRK